MTSPRRTIASALLVGVVVLGGCMPAAAEEAAVTLRPAATASPRPTPARTPRPTAVPTPHPTPVPTPSPTLPPALPFALNLFEEGDFVPQHTFDWCVGASIQMAWNLVRDTRRNSYGDQQRLWEMARARSTNSFRGANPRGWASVLTEIGLGDYELVSIPDYDQALRTAASSLRQTNRPVGLVMWRGRHAWVMSGFESVGDPALRPDFTVTGIRVLDPLYPHGSGTWGPSPLPNSLLSPEQLAAQFVIREPRRWSGDLAAGYLLVLPV
jgi:hypothetical protein